MPFMQNAHSGIDEKKFSGIINWMTIFWINDGYLGKSSNPALYVMGFVRKPTLHLSFLQHQDR